MPARPLEQEFVAHLFAPVDGPHAEVAARQLAALWERCRSELMMTEPIDGTGLSVRLPDDPAAAGDGALGGLQDRTVTYQAIVRREHDVLNFSLVMATPLDAPRRRFGLGVVAPPGWEEFHRWWARLTGQGITAFLGAATVYQGKTRTVSGPEIRAALPSSDADAAGWWLRPRPVAGLTVWDVSPGDARATRRLVVTARPGQDAALSRFTWSSGDVALPPLGRYLMHAAKLRYNARVRGDGNRLTELRERARGRLDRVAELLSGPAGAATAEAPGLAADAAALAGAVEAVRTMRRSVEVARDNMTRIMTEPLPSDAAQAAWLDDQLAHDTEYLEATLQRAVRLREMVGVRPAVQATPPTVLTPDLPPPGPATSEVGRVEQRMGFGIDVVSYSGRSTLQQAEVQRRVAGMASAVLAELGLRLADVDRQDAGDGMMVVLPAAVEAHRALPALLNGWQSRVAADNAAHPADRIRLRLAVAGGPFTAAAIGFTGNTIIEMGRLLDCAVVRAAVTDHPMVDLIAIVSDRVHADVVREGYPGVDAARFERRRVQLKTYAGDAWLWVGPAASGQRSEPAPGAREVFLIHGADDAAARAVIGMLRALGLQPLDWAELAARTGESTPSADDVLEQGFAGGGAAIVLLTPDECVERHSELLAAGETTEPGLQAGADVLVRAGMAMARRSGRTVVIELGRQRRLAGLETLRISAEPVAQASDLRKIAQRLRLAGCAVDTTGTEWLSTERFRGLGAFTRTATQPV